jgi:hypothetical protein
VGLIGGEQTATLIDGKGSVCPDYQLGDVIKIHRRDNTKGEALRGKAAHSTLFAQFPGCFKLHGHEQYANSRDG